MDRLIKEAGEMIKDNSTGKKKRNIIKLALVLILVVGLYPPWIQTFKALPSHSTDKTLSSK
jgi:hypothetical protein